jgi:hypothetical protein
MPRSSAPNQQSDHPSAQRPETSVHPIEPADPQSISSARAPQREALRHNVEGG